MSYGRVSSRSAHVLKNFSADADFFFGGLEEDLCDVFLLGIIFDEILCEDEIGLEGEIWLSLLSCSMSLGGI